MEIQRLKCCLITATKGRHKHLERLVRFMVDQSYPNFVHLIFNNSEGKLKLSPDLDKDKFILINQHLDSVTGKSYATLGDIYNDAIKHVPDDVDVIGFADDDDIFLPNHVEEGIKGLLKGGKLAYKPQKSWYKYVGGISLAENTLEPSIFIKASHIKQHGFAPETTAQHYKWLNPLIKNKEIFVDPDGLPTFVCDWSQEIPTFKTSGNPSNPRNFQNYEDYSKDNGDGVITPCSTSWGKHYCRIVKPT